MLSEGSLADIDSKPARISPIYRNGQEGGILAGSHAVKVSELGRQGIDFVFYMSQEEYNEELE